MASFSEDDGILRIPATSPCRRDYQLRSFSSTQLSEYEISRPQSPWLPRSESQSEEVSSFRRYESNVASLDASNRYSGPLRGAQQGVARSYYSGPLPSPSPLPSYFSGAALPGFMTTATNSFVARASSKGYQSRQLVEANSVPGRLPEVGSSRESSFREENEVSAAEGDNEVDEVAEALYSSHVRKEDGKATPRNCKMASPSPVDSLAQNQNVKVRNCVSGELGMRFELAQQRAQVARGYKSGEIAGLEICANGIYLSAVEALVKGGREISVRKQMSSESLASEALNDVENERPDYELAMVAIPFKWEDMPGDSSKKSCSRSSSVSMSGRITSEQKLASELQLVAANEPCFRSSHRFYDGSKEGADSKRWSESEAKPAARAAAKLEKSSSVSSPKPMPKGLPKKGVSSAVPFKWEVEPGKPKIEEKASRSPEGAPALQLPPRLASTTSMKRNSWCASAPSSRRNSSVSAAAGSAVSLTNRARQPSRSLSASVTTSSFVGKRSLQSQEDPPSPPQNGRRTLAAAFRSNPLDNTARPSDFTPKRGSSGPIPSQFGSPQYQSAEYLCEHSVPWSRVRSPTSTLCGPGSDSHSNPSSCKSDKSSRQSSTSFSHSQSGTSEESFEQWSYGDHISPTSRQPSIRESPESERCMSRADSVRGHEESVKALGGTMTKLRRKLILKSSSSKPPMSPIRSSPLAVPAASSRSVDANGYSSHGEEYFDCQGGGSSPFSNLKNELHFDTEDKAEVEPPTRLPYKMPSPVNDIELKAVSATSSPTRSGSEFTNCLALPRFLTKSETLCLWVENPSWNLPDVPTNTIEDGFKSPAYKATLELLSPSPNLMSKKRGSRSVSKLPQRSSSRRRHPHLVEVLCNSLKQSLQRCTKRSVARTQSIDLYENQFTKRHQSFMW